MSHISGHIIHLFSTPLLFLTFLFLLISQLIITLFPTFPPLFYHFIFSLLSTLISLFFYLFIFLYFWLFLFPSSYYKFVILSPILCMFSHTKGYFSFSLNFFFIFRWIFYFSCISSFGW